jgi:3-methyl-2-oxobutanoate hydroxymethyltransferase
MQKKLTVKDILGSRGKRKLTEIYTHTVLEAEACEAAGIDMIITSELNDYERIRSAAPNTFFTVGLSYGAHLDEHSILKRSFYLMNKGADAIYCPQSTRFIKAIADEGIPVIGHSGFIPYKSTHYGGFKAVGKTNVEAKKILSEIIRIKEAGAFAVELEIVPSKVAAEISKAVEIFLIGMGSGVDCDAQYLFSEDVLGYNKGHIPRHAKVYSDLHKDFDALQNKAVKAYSKFANEVRDLKYPSSEHDISIANEEFDQFSDFIKKSN